MTRLVREKIWDPVTRLWHWVFVVVVATGWSLGTFMAFETVRWHFYLGYTVLPRAAALAARVVSLPAPDRAQRAERRRRT